MSVASASGASRWELQRDGLGTTAQPSVRGQRRSLWERAECASELSNVLVHSHKAAEATALERQAGDCKLLSKP